MKKVLFAICAVVLLAAGAMAAVHGGGGHPMKMGDHSGGHAMKMEKMGEHLTKVLNLTEEQQAAAKQLHQEVFAKAEPLMEQRQQLHQELEALLDGANPDPAAVGNKAIAAHAIGAQLKALHEDAMTRFTTLLTDEQKAKLEKMHEMHGKGGHGSGHGPSF